MVVSRITARKRPDLAPVFARLARSRPLDAASWGLPLDPPR
jgi:hypothetical protein